MAVNKDRWKGHVCACVRACVRVSVLCVEVAVNAINPTSIIPLKGLGGGGGGAGGSIKISSLHLYDSVSDERFVLYQNYFEQ